MEFSKEQVEHLARLSRLALDEQEIEHLRGQLGAILSYVEKLDELDVSDVEATTHAVPLQMMLREDEVDGRLSQADVLANAPDVDQAQFRVPKVVSD